MAGILRDSIESTAFAFRGYDIKNLGRSRELLERPRYAAIIEKYLTEAGEICADVTGKPVDLIARVRCGEETSLATYHEAIALIIGMELAQIEILEEVFDISFRQAAVAFGYSLGELAAAIAGGVYEMRHALRLPLAVSEDCVALTDNVTMGVLFSRGPVLDFTEVARLCLWINAEGAGVIGISAFLAPNTVLLLGQGTTIDRLIQAAHSVFPDRVYVRKNSEHWPPMHTPIVWQRNIPNRIGVMMHSMPGGFTAPSPPIISLVTGKRSYNDHNARELMLRWIDHPQRLWDAVYDTLASGVRTVIHVGPNPNLIPATYRRLSENVLAQQTGSSLGSFGRRAMARVARRPWLTAVLPSRAALLRAPTIEHIILEDWLLERDPG